MSANDALVVWIAEALVPFGPLRSTRMFGGTGVYCEGLFFALIFGGDLYLKADVVTVARFDALGLLPFTYVARNRERSINYRRPPEECLDDADVMRDWAARAIAAAPRATEKAASSRPSPG